MIYKQLTVHGLRLHHDADEVLRQLGVLGGVEGAQDRHQHLRRALTDPRHLAKGTRNTSRDQLTKTKYILGDTIICTVGFVGCFLRVLLLYQPLLPRQAGQNSKKTAYQTLMYSI